MRDNTSEISRKLLNILSELNIITPDTNRYPGGMLFTMDEANDWVQSLMTLKQMQVQYDKNHSPIIDELVRTQRSGS